MSTFSGPSGSISKPEVIRLFLEHEGRVMLCLDATRKDVDVPRRFATDVGLRLILNKSMPQPIYINPDAVESELRFGGIPHYCVIPYDALWAVYNPEKGQGMLWPESMPDPVRERYLARPQSDGSSEFPMEFPTLMQTPPGTPSVPDPAPARAPRKARTPQEPLMSRNKPKEPPQETDRPVLRIVPAGGMAETDPPPTSTPPSVPPAGGNKPSRPKLTLVQ
jgi:stringent starvation protein B